MLNTVFGTVGAIVTAVVYMVSPGRQVWWLPLMLIGSYLAVALLYLLLLAVVSLFLPRREGGPDHPFVNALIARTLAWAFGFIGRRIRLTGAERLPDEPFLLVGNHLSALDPLVTLAALGDRRIAFISKPENFRIPVVGPFIRFASFLSIDRSNARNAVTTIHTAANFITERRLCMGIYPEGTRSKTGELQAFHPGSFKIATLAHCPIAVVAIGYAGRRVTLDVVDVMDAAFVAAHRTNDLCERARSAIAAHQNRAAKF